MDSARSEPQPNGPLPRQVRWARWWIILWAIVAIGLILAVCLRASFWAWLPAAFVGFGVMEGYGLSSAEDAYPPLTQVTREYSPRWLTFLLIYGVVGLAGGTWFHFARRWWLAALAALLGWLTAHFDVTYDAPAVKQENTKYQWYARRLHLHRVERRLVANQHAREKREATNFR